MKPSTLPQLVVAAVVLAWAPHLMVAGPEEIEFAGYVETGTERLFVLRDLESRKVSSWLKLGEAWSGYRLVSLDDPADELVLEKDGETSRHKLHIVKIGDDPSSPRVLRGTYTIVGDTLVYSPDARLRVAANVFVTATRGSLVFDKKQRTLSGDLAVEFPNSVTLAENGVLEIMNGNPVIRAPKLEWSEKPPRQEPATVPRKALVPPEPRRP